MLLVINYISVLTAKILILISLKIKEFYVVKTKILPGCRNRGLLKVLYFLHGNVGFVCKGRIPKNDDHVTSPTRFSEYLISTIRMKTVKSFAIKTVSQLIFSNTSR